MDFFRTSLVFVLLMCAYVNGQCEFMRTLPSNITVLETDGPGTDILSFDNEGDSEVSFEVLYRDGHSPARRIKEFFAMETVNVTSTLRLTKSLDLEALKVIIGAIDGFDLRISCESAIDTTVHDISLIITPVDEFYPYFIGPPYTITVKEDLQRGNVVFSLSKNVGDLDIMSDTERTYSLHPYRTISEFDGRQNYEIPEETVGDIVVKSPVDFEWMRAHGRQFYMLNVSVQDYGGHSTFTTVKIMVQDADDQGPVFVYEGCGQPCEHISILTYTTVNYTGSLFVEPLEVKDQDTLNSPVVFRLLPDEELVSDENVTYFEVDRFNGTIFQTRPLIGTNSSVFQLTLEAVETTSNRTITANITIIVSDRANLKKKFVKGGSRLGPILPVLDPPLGGSGRKTTTLVGDLKYFNPAKFHQNPFSGPEAEDEM